MAPMILSLLFSSLLVFFHPPPSSTASAISPSPYLSGTTTLLRDYQNMLTKLKIFVYNNDNPSTNLLISFQNYSSAAAFLFYDSLLHSPFITDDPAQAHLFFVPFSPLEASSTRSIGRVVRQIRNTFPYWNRTLGADHFFVSPSGIDYSSDRNVLELKKNAVQISVFPVTSGYFIPHKDITLPPPYFDKPLPSSSFSAQATEEKNSSSASTTLLAYLNWDGMTESDIVDEMKSKLGNEEFLVLGQPEPSDHAKSIAKSKFCLFLYHGDVSTLVESMRMGCVPVVIVDRPIQDLPLMDVLRWSDVVILVRGSLKKVKEVLSGISEQKYVEMRESAVAASKHLQWNAEPKLMDAFHMVMYQLWMRRHVVRYTRREYV